MFQFLIYFGLPLGLLPLLLLIFFKIENPVYQRLLPVYLLVFVSSFYELVFSLILPFDVRNWFVIYGILSFSCFTFYFYVLLNKRFPILLIFLIFVAILFRLVLFLPFVPFYDISYLLKDGICSSIDTLVIAVGSVLWFKNIFLEMK